LNFSYLNQSFFTEIFLYSERKPLLFTQIYFWVFLSLVLLFYSIVYKKNILRSIYLFFISLFFYYKSGGYFFSLLLISIITDYCLAWLIYKSKKRSLKKVYVALSLIVNLGILAYFKYSYFIIDSLNQFSDSGFEAQNILAAWSNRFLGSNFDVSVIILPIGISFYTFQTISYTIDVYRNKLKPVKNIFDFGFYVSFFPQLVAGPIVRAAQFIPQIYAKYKLSKREMSHALFLIVSGLIKKILISDTISIHFVDRVFDDPLAFSGFENLAALYGYALQIYCDFSGYTDMAIGIALLMGFRLPVNFYSPYKARNLTDFWRRWHISLSSWLRDYLYIPLGGNRKGKFRGHLNVFITMLLGGLWHGANIRFVLWGGLHGLGLIITKICRGLKKSNKEPGKISRFISVFLTFHFVVFLWLFFRSDSWDSALHMMQQIMYHFDPRMIPAVFMAYKFVFLLIAAGFVIHWLPSGIKEWYRAKFILSPLWLKAIAIVVLMFILYQVKSTELQPFIYFRF